MENFTPVTGLIGGIIVGIAATLLLWFNGRIAGISGIFNGMSPSAARVTSSGAYCSSWA